MTIIYLYLSIIVILYKMRYIVVLKNMILQKKVTYLTNNII